MKRRGLTGRTGWTGAKVPFVNPLDLLAEDHATLRRICADLVRLAGAGSLERRRVEAMYGFLCERLADHMADEDEGLFPMLRNRCDPAEDILPTLDRLGEDHADLHVGLGQVLTGLNRMLGTQQGLTRQEAKGWRTFAALKLRHVIVETAIILPLARGLLSRRDLQELMARMLTRRGPNRLVEAPNAD